VSLPTQHPRHSSRGTLFALLAIGLWGLSATLSARLSHLPSMFLVGVTFSIAGLSRINKLPTWKAPIKVWAIGVGAIFTYYLLYYYAFQRAPAAEVSLINYLWPLFILLFTPAYFKEFHLERRHILGGIAGLLGAGLVITGGSLNMNPGYLVGYACAFVIALIWANYTLAIKCHQPLPDTLVSGFCLVTGLIGLAVYFGSGSSMPASISTLDWVWIALLGIGPNGLAFVAWNMAFKEGDPRVVASLSYLTPLLSMLTLVLTGTGSLGPYALVGMLLIIAGAAYGAGLFNKRMVLAEKDVSGL
jgi:drug/metabolite transporter (DMT)-like permease